jgi:SAM-dependent methyltransferase
MDDSEKSVDDAKTKVLIGLIREQLNPPLSRILVVGCGSGREAGILARNLRSETIGIDIGAEFVFDHEAATPAILRNMDAEALEFEDASFDLIYSFHALEHIRNFRQALLEMSRVLRPGGTFCIGTPNKARLLGYLNSSASSGEKIYWNVVDLSMRMRGRWSNEKGAHAGFYADDLFTYCREYFGEAREVTDIYYLSLYPRHHKLLELLSATNLKYRIFPCVYMIGRKSPMASSGQQ